MERQQRILQLTALALALGAAACTDTGSVLAPDAAAPAFHRGSGGGQPTSAPAPSKSTAKFEIRFMEGMIDHHHMAVMMGETCVQKAVHEELRSMCEEIIAAQTAEIEDMQSWLLQWYGIRYEPQMKPGEVRQMERLASLSGAEYEIAFMEEMIRHHRMAIMEARMCLKRVYHPELRQLCENIIATQSAEIAQMRSWLCEWYGVCKKEG